jgi:hypothetical protein
MTMIKGLTKASQAKLKKALALQKRQLGKQVVKPRVELCALPNELKR